MPDPCKGIPSITSFVCEDTEQSLFRRTHSSTRPPGQLATAWSFLSAMNVHVELSASYSRHLPSSSTSHRRRIRTTQLVNSAHSSGRVSWGPSSVIISGIRWASVASSLFHILLKQSFETETRGRKQQRYHFQRYQMSFTISTTISVRGLNWHSSPPTLLGGLCAPPPMCCVPSCLSYKYMLVTLLDSHS